jgi:S1-C subfamily serine protease
MMVPGPAGDLGGLTAPAGPLRYAMPINLALAIYEPMLERGSRVSPWLGFSVLDLRAARQRLAARDEPVALPPAGVYIDDVFEPSPAARVDVRIGDTLTAIDGHPIASVSDFQARLYLSGVGRDVTLEIQRAGERLEKRATVEQRPAAAVPR